MALTGKLESEIELHSPAAKFFNFFVTQLHDLSKVADSVQDGKLHQGDDWHGVGSDNVKQWTFVVDGMEHTCKEHLLEIDHANKTKRAKFFDGDIGKQYKNFEMTLKVSEKESGNVANWTIEYDKLNEGIPPPQSFLDMIIHITKDVDAHLNKTT